MGRGRAPCCDKNKVKKGPWSPAEDLRLISFIHKHGHTNWRSLPNQAGLLRCGKSCRLRWINYLRPDVKRGNFTPEEEQIIIKLHNSFGNKWSKIASHLPGRTDNEIKNVWNSHLKKRVHKKDVGSHESETKRSTIRYAAISSSSSDSITSCGEKNMEKGLGDQDDQQSMAKNPNKKQQNYLTLSPRKCNLIDETKEHSGSNSPSSSYASNFSSLGQVDISNPNEETSLTVNITGTCDQGRNAMSEVTNQLPSSQAFEIPLESDIDFWNILNTLDSSKSSESQPHKSEVCHRSSNSGEDLDPQVECKKWLKDLEYELGLLGESNDDNQEMDTGSQVNTESAQSDMILQPEIDIAIDCFPIWPLSPQSFGI